MSRANQSPPYSLLGRFYDQLVPEGPAMNRHVRRKLLGHLLRRPDTVCDLGCGTGTTAIELAQAGHKVYAVDASAEQCRQATRKIRAAKVKVRVIQERNLWRRYHERIEDTWWSNSEIQAALRRTGFGHVQAWDGARVRPRKMNPRKGFDRYYLAQRNT